MKKTLDKMTKSELIEICEKSKELFFYLQTKTDLEKVPEFKKYVNEIFENAKE